MTNLNQLIQPTMRAGNKSIIIQGVTLYFLTDEKFHVALENINAVIIYAYKEAPNRPLFFQRYCDYIDSISIAKLELVEAESPFIINKEVYPMSYKLAYRKQLLDLQSLSLEDYNELVDSQENL